MKNEFVNTANVKNFLKGMTALSMRGAREACLMVIDGKPGLGKTRALSFWACRNDCVFVRAKKECRKADRRRWRKILTLLFWI